MVNLLKCSVFSFFMTARMVAAIAILSFVLIVQLTLRGEVFASNSISLSEHSELHPASRPQVGVRGGVRTLDHLLLSNADRAYVYPSFFSMPIGMITWRSFPFEYGGLWGFQAQLGFGRAHALTRGPEGSISAQALDLYLIPIGLGLGYERAPGIFNDLIRPSLGILLEYQGYVQSSSSTRRTIRSGELGVDVELTLGHPLRWAGFPMAMMELGIQRIWSIQKRSGDFSGMIGFLGVRHTL